MIKNPIAEVRITFKCDGYEKDIDISKAFMNINLPNGWIRIVNEEQGEYTLSCEYGSLAFDTRSDVPHKKGECVLFRSMFLDNCETIGNTLSALSKAMSVDSRMHVSYSDYYYEV